MASCPTFVSGSLQTLSCAYSKTCTYNYQLNQNGSSTYNSSSGSSTDIIGYDTSALIDRLCFPSTATLSSGFATIQAAVSTSFSNAISTGSMGGFYSDLKNNWMWLLCGFGFCVVISFIFMFLLRCLAGLIVWLSLLGTLVVLVGLGLLFLYNSGNYSILSTAATTLGITPYAISSQYNLAIGWTLIGVAGLFLIIVLCCCSRIRLAVAVCKCAGQFVVSVCLIVLVPIIQTAIAIAFWGGALVMMVYLISAASFTNDVNTYYTYISNYADYSLIRLYCFLFGTLWVNAFLSAMGIFVISSSCCMWYYSHGPGQELSLPIFRSYKMIFRYHFGSLAFGSFILALVQFLQILVELFKKQA